MHRSACVMALATVVACAQGALTIDPNSYVHAGVNTPVFQPITGLGSGTHSSYVGLSGATVNWDLADTAFELDYSLSNAAGSPAVGMGGSLHFTTDQTIPYAIEELVPAGLFAVTGDLRGSYVVALVQKPNTTLFGGLYAYDWSAGGQIHMSDLQGVVGSPTGMLSPGADYSFSILVNGTHDGTTSGAALGGIALHLPEPGSGLLGLLVTLYLTGLRRR